MEPSSPAPGSDAKARLARARDSISSSAAQITTSLGSVVALTGKPIHISQPLWRRTAVFASSDLDGILRPTAQAEVARLLRPLISTHHWVDHARWTPAPGTHDADQPGREELIGRDGGITVTTTVDSVELLAEVFAEVAGAIESLTTRLTARTVIEAPIPASESAYVREIDALISRVSTRPDATWMWETRHDAAGAPPD